MTSVKEVLYDFGRLNIWWYYEKLSSIEKIGERRTWCI